VVSLMRARTAALVVLVLLVGALSGCTAPKEGLTLRLWDPQVAEAYRLSLDAFEASTGVHVDVVVVPWADYWTQLRADVGAGAGDDVFWLNAANYQEYAQAGAIIPVAEDQVAAQATEWPAAAIAQYTADGQLWGVPQITDPGIGILYNADLLAAAGHTPGDLESLSWDPTAADDSLRDIARTMTRDADGRRPGESGFDPDRIAQYGFGASNDLNAVLLQFLAANGAQWQDGDRFTFASDAGVDAISYVADLINVDHVAPSAADTNPPAGGDFVRDQFLRGRVALFPTGAYNLANIDEGADFPWGISPLPAGPKGAISVTNSVVLAASASSAMPAAQRELLDWLGSAQGQRSIGESGTALPAVAAAQTSYAAFWAARGVDISPMIDVLAGGSIQPPQGARYPEASAALQPLLNDVFLGRVDATKGLREAEDLANQAMSPTQ